MAAEVNFAALTFDEIVAIAEKNRAKRKRKDRWDARTRKVYSKLLETCRHMSTRFSHHGSIENHHILVDTMRHHIDTLTALHRLREGKTPDMTWPPGYVQPGTPPTKTSFEYRREGD